MSCNLYKIPQAVTPVTITYTDCDGIDQLVVVPISADYYFCSTNLISVPKETVEISICITSPPPTTPLLYTLLKLRGPCPDICNGITKLGGLTGTDDVNIITQNPL